MKLSSAFLNPICVIDVIGRASMRFGMWRTPSRTTTVSWVNAIRVINDQEPLIPANTVSVETQGSILPALEFAQISKHDCLPVHGLMLRRPCLSAVTN